MMKNTTPDPYTFDCCSATKRQQLVTCITYINIYVCPGNTCHAMCQGGQDSLFLSHVKSAPPVSFLFCGSTAQNSENEWLAYLLSPPVAFSLARSSLSSLSLPDPLKPATRRKPGGRSVGVPRPFFVARDWRSRSVGAVRSSCCCN